MTALLFKAKTRKAYLPMRTQARRTIRARYDLKTVCLPAQLRLMDAVRAVVATPRRG